MDDSNHWTLWSSIDVEVHYFTQFLRRPQLNLIIYICMYACISVTISNFKVNSVNHWISYTCQDDDHDVILNHFGFGLFSLL